MNRVNSRNDLVMMAALYIVVVIIIIGKAIVCIFIRLYQEINWPKNCSAYWKYFVELCTTVNLSLVATSPLPRRPCTILYSLSLEEKVLQFFKTFVVILDGSEQGTPWHL